MIVTSLTALAVSVRSTLTRGTSNEGTAATTAAPKPHSSAPPIDTVELSQQAAAAARSTDPSARAETLLKAFDIDGDGVVTKTEFMAGAMEVLKRASLSFHHQRVGRGEITSAPPAEQPVTAASLALGEYAIISRAKDVPKA